MPVHLASSLADENVASSLELRELLFQCAGEFRYGGLWDKDARVWELADRDGNTVKDY